MTRAPLLLAVFLVAIPACEDSAPVERGFASRQVTALRDPTFSFAGARGDLVLYWTGDEPATTRYWSIDVITGAVREHDFTFSDVPVPQFTIPSDPNARFHCTYGTGEMNVQEYRIDDAQTGQRTTIASPEHVAGCPSEANQTLKMWRRDGTGHLTFWTGRYDDLQMAPIDLAVLKVVQQFRTSDVSVNVLAGRPEQPDGLGLFAIDLASFAVTELVSPTLQSGAWAEGAIPAGDLVSTSLFPNASENRSGVLPVGDHFVYWRSIADGAPTAFVGPLGSGPARELALFPGDPAIAKTGVESFTGSPAPPTWQRRAVESSDFLVWDDGRQRLVTCTAGFRSALPDGLQGGFASGRASPDASKVALVIAQSSSDLLYGSSARTGPLLLVDLTSAAGGTAPCTVLAPSQVSAAGFSPDGSTLFWLMEPPDPTMDTSLWLAAPDGSAPRLVGTDQIKGPPNAPRFVGASQLQLQIGGDLLWLDIHDDPILTHPIVEHVRGTAIDRGRWLLIGYDASEQDGTARLGLINRDTGEKRLISPDVTEFMTPDSSSSLGAMVIPGPRALDDPLRIVYLVRGRNPSSQDGLWIATITQEDTP